MGPPSYMRSVVDRNVVIWRIPVFTNLNLKHQSACAKCYYVYLFLFDWTTPSTVQNDNELEAIWKNKVDATNLQECFLINIRKVKPKIYLYTAKNAYRGSGDKTPHILDLGTRFERPTSCHARSVPRTAPGTQWTGRRVASRAVWTFSITDLLPLMRFERRTVQPVV